MKEDCQKEFVFKIDYAQIVTVLQQIALHLHKPFIP